MDTFTSVPDRARPTILFVITDLEVGGVPLHLYRLANAARDHGYHPVVASLATPGPVGEMLRRDGITVLGCGAAGIWDLRALARLARMIREVAPDVIHALLFHANVAVRLAALEAGFPPDRILCEIQTVEVERPWHLTVDRWTHRLSRLTIGNSPSVIEHLAVRGRIPRSRLHLVRGGVDPARFEKVDPISRAALELPPDAPIILWVGRLDPVKGLDMLIDAFHQVAEKTRAHLMLVGDGPLRGNLREKVAEMTLGSRVHLVGARSDVPSLLKAATLFVFPSRTEGLPNALLEAMAVGCPIVTTDVAGCRDLVRHGRNGLLVPYGDVFALAGAMMRLLNNLDEASRLGAAAAASVKDQWHVRRTYEAYFALYDSVRAQGPRRRVTRP